jgi:hypothetical protein
MLCSGVSRGLGKTDCQMDSASQEGDSNRRPKEQEETIM